MTLLEQTRESVLQHLRGEVSMVRVDDERVACTTPFHYPDGDAVTVWVREEAGVFHLTDYGEGFLKAIASRRRASRDRAGAICRRWGAAFVDGRISIEAKLWQLGEAVLAAASASDQVARLGLEAGRAEKAADGPRPAREFRDLLVRALRGLHAEVDEDAKIIGQSGKVHKVSIFLPDLELLVAALPTRPPVTTVASSYMRLADCTAANGYRALSVIDDRDEPADEATLALMSQVGATASWSRLPEWSVAVLGQGEHA